MKFAYPTLLLLVPILGLGALVLYKIARKRMLARLRLFSPDSRLETILLTLNPTAKKRKFILVTSALILLVAALARPLWGPKSDTADQVGAEFYLVLDISRSMQVRDVKQDRLEAVKESLAKWLKTRHGDRIGLILVAGDAFVQAPLTSDYTALTDVLMQSDPNAISLGGTNLSAAIVTATKALKDSDQLNKLVVIISDGEDLDGDPAAYVRQARAELDNRLTFVTVGVGTAQGGQVPFYSRNEKIDYSKPPENFVRNEYNVVANSRLDERELRKIAQAGGGRYYDFQPDNNVWNTLYTQEIQPLAKQIGRLDINDYTELFQIPLALALILLASDFAMKTRLRNPPPARSVVSLPEPGTAPATTAMENRRPATRRKRPEVAKTLPIILALLLPAIVATAVEPEVFSLERAETLVREGRGEEAATMLWERAQKNPDDLYALYNYGIAAYANGNYQEASEAFSSVSGSQNAKLRSLALTQIANAHYRLGEQLVDKTVDGALVAWERSVEYYDDSINEKSLTETKHNRGIVAAQLEKLLIEKGTERLERAQNDDLKDKVDMKARVLSEAVEKFEKAVALNPDNAEATSKLAEANKLYVEALVGIARDHRDDAYASKKQAEEFSNQAETEKDKKKSQKLRQESSHLRDVENRQRADANERYEQALEVAPENEAVKNEYSKYQDEQATFELDDAGAFLSEADAVENKNEVKKLEIEGKLVQKALDKIDQALALDEGNGRGEKMQKDARDRMENLLMERAKLRAETGKEALEKKNPESARNTLTAAADDLQHALEIAPDNKEAQDLLSNVQENLAEAYAAIGDNEMATAQELAGAATPKSQPADAGEKPDNAKDSEGAGKPESSDEGAPGVKELQKQIGHTEKAAQSFAQADALAPGKNEAARKGEEAVEKLNELRNQLDGALAKAAAEAAEAGEGQAGEPGKSGEPGEPGKSGEPDKPGQPAPGGESLLGGGAPDIPVLSFSEVRGGTEQEGQFVDKSKKKQIRDW